MLSKRSRKYIILFNFSTFWLELTITSEVTNDKQINDEQRRITRLFGLGGYNIEVSRENHRTALTENPPQEIHKLWKTKTYRKHVYDDTHN